MSTRHNHYAAIAIAKKENRIAEVTYRGHLMHEYGVTSAKALNDVELTQVRAWCTGRPAKLPQAQPVGEPKPKPKSKAAPAADLVKYFKKMDAQLISLGNLPRSYAEAIAQRMFKRPLVWCAPFELRAVITALDAEQLQRGAPRG